MSDALMDKARAFFDRKRGLQSEKDDPELVRAQKKLRMQVDTARDDKKFKAALINTLSILERDMKNRQDQLADRLVAEARNSGKKLSSDELAAAVTSGIPRELRYLQAAGLSLVQARNSNTKMSERELRKFSERSAKFAATVDSLRTEGSKGKDYAQLDTGGGLSLTDRLRQYQEGKLLDGKRHTELLEKLEEGNTAAEKRDKEHDKDSTAKKLGLTALFGPAAPLFQLWYDAKEELKQLREDGSELLQKTKQKFKWETDKEVGDERAERKHTSLLDRLLKAMKLQEQGKKGKGLRGWLFGGDSEGPDVDLERSRDARRSRRMARNRGRALGRTTGRMGRGLAGIAGAAGRGIASVARPAWKTITGVGSALGTGAATAGRSAVRGIGNLGRVAGSGLANAGRVAGSGIANAGRVAAPVAGNIGRSALGFGGRALGGLAAGGMGAVAGATAAVAGAGYLGYKAGSYINDHLLTQDQKDQLGDLIDSSVSTISSAISGAGTAIETAGARVRGFFTEAGQSTVESWEAARKTLTKKSVETADYMNERLTATSDILGKWGEEAKDKLRDFWDAFRFGVSGAVSVVRKAAENAGAAAAPVVAAVKKTAAPVVEAASTATQSAVTGARQVGRRAADFFRGESGGLQVGRFSEEEQASIRAARAGGDKFRGGQGITAEHRQMIMDTAAKQGLNPEHLLAMVQMESGGNPNAVSATGATGLLQFTGGTGRQMGVKNRFDPRQNVEAGGQLMSQNAAALKKAGIEPTLENLYLAHQQGAAGAVQIINAANGKGKLTDEVRKNMGLNYGNMDPSEYLAQNKKKIETARLTATTGTQYAGSYARTTGPDGKPIAVPEATAATAVAAAAGAPSRTGAPIRTPGSAGTGTAVASATRAPAGPGAQVGRATGIQMASLSRPLPKARTVEPAPTSGFRRVAPQAPWSPQEPQKQESKQATSTGSTRRVGMEKQDFYVDDLGILLLNRGVTG